jgi:hypothetical protein
MHNKQDLLGQVSSIGVQDCYSNFGSEMRVKSGSDSVLEFRFKFRVGIQCQIQGWDSGSGFRVIYKFRIQGQIQGRDSGSNSC